MGFFEIYYKQACSVTIVLLEYSSTLMSVVRFMISPNLLTTSSTVKTFYLGRQSKYFGSDGCIKNLRPLYEVQLLETFQIQQLDLH